MVSKPVFIFTGVQLLNEFNHISHHSSSVLWILNGEAGSSSLLTALPLTDQGFHLNKQEFGMRYIYYIAGN